MKSWLTGTFSVFTTMVTVTIVCSSFGLFAQTNNGQIQVTNPSASIPVSPTEQPIRMLKPIMTVGDIAFVINILNSVNLTGNEVNSFMEVKGTFIKVLDQAQKDKKGENDVVTIELNIAQANAYYTLLQRATVAGALAEKFQSIQTALITAANVANNNSQQNVGKK